MYIHEQPDWPNFTWQDKKLVAPLERLHHLHGRLLGQLDALGALPETAIDHLTQDVVRSAEIEGEALDARQVRSSVARRLGITIPDMLPTSQAVEGMVDLTFDSIHHCHEPLTQSRMQAWHGAMFPTGRSGLYQIQVGAWRDDSLGPMQVVSGGFGQERIHFQAPDAKRVPREMDRFLAWYETAADCDSILKAAIAHLWFVTIHPFDDGNGRIARALTDLLLARMDGANLRFYSLSSQILAEREAYYRILEFTQSGDLEITEWLLWFVGCFEHALKKAEETLQKVLMRHRFWHQHESLSFNERHRKLLNLLLDDFEGKLTTSKWAKIAHCSTDTALRDIQFLLDHEILAKDLSGGRSTNYELNAKALEHGQTYAKPT